MLILRKRSEYALSWAQNIWAWVVWEENGITVIDEWPRKKGGNHRWILQQFVFERFLRTLEQTDARNFASARLVPPTAVYFSVNAPRLYPIPLSTMYSEFGFEQFSSLKFETTWKRIRKRWRSQIGCGGLPNFNLVSASPPLEAAPSAIIQ